MVFQIMHFWWVKMSVYNLVRRRPKFTNFFFNAELTVFDKAYYCL